MAKAARFRRANLQRRRAFIEQRAHFLLICEGRNSEPLYFSALGRILRRTIVEPVKGGGTPGTVADRAVEEARSRGLLSGRGRKKGAARNDQVWAVFDRDQHEHYDEAVAKCQANGIGLARSNPSFEVWLILHFEEFNRPDGRELVFEHFCKLQPDYREGKGRRSNFGALIQNIEAAEVRATRQLAARAAEGQPYGPPSTTVQDLTIVLRGRG
jgi:hypothetical protein